MDGSDIKLVIQKKLFASDLKQSQNRLSMPFNQLETHDFLTPDEIEILNRHKHDENCLTKLGIEVGLLGPTFEMYDKKIEFKIWDMQKTHNYVLITNWYNFVMDHKNILKEGANIQVWSFRKKQELCFAVACVDHKPKADKIHDGENINCC
uniref:putative B3 domain-containing protein At3g24850 n=1 Tax=Erigeron canadensis TaxID=72917 RepID=UPI001CB8F0BD|nr:putative B3 domain-containing protein At3g24850 [Erigeron canadensis]